MNYFGVRSASDQYIPKKGAARPSWTYRAARRNAARLAHWPSRYRWRVWLSALKAKLGIASAMHIDPEVLYHGR